MNPYFSRIALLLISLALPAAAEFRTFTNQDGRSLEAEVLAVNGDSARMRLQGGTEFTLSLSQLLPADQAYLREWSPKVFDPGLVEKLNEAVGQPLFEVERTLWESEAAAVAKRLGWPKESETAFSSSYRKYCPAEYRFFGARPYSAVVYAGAEGRPERFSLVYANKGDYFSAAGTGEDHFRSGGESGDQVSLEAAMAEAEDGIAVALNSVLSEGSPQRFGEGSTRRTVRRWDFEGHAFLLSHVKGEYVGLVIVSTENADSGGRAGLIADQVLRERLEKNVVRKENGDVLLSNLPMVDQGPKGYCVPATFERAMRYMAIPADMYLLAQAGQSGAGGGTVTSILVDEVKSEVSSKARRLREVDLGRFKLSLVQRYIDKGVPILWQMCSLTAYNETANRRTQERAGVTDWSAWSDRVQSEKDALLASGDLEREENHHICLIVGYNAETGEIAVSDSWGPRYELRWVHLEEAGAVSMGSGYVIDL